MNIVGKNPVIETSDLVYIFAAGSWVSTIANASATRSVDHYYIFIILFTFVMIPIEYHTSSVWKRVVSSFPSDFSDKHLWSKDTPKMAVIDILRMLCLTLSIIYISTPIDPSITNKMPISIYISIIGMFLILNSAWNNLAFFDKIFGLPSKDNSYKRLFNAYYLKVINPRGHDQITEKIDDLLIKCFEKGNYHLFVYIYPFFGITAFFSGIISHYFNYSFDLHRNIIKDGILIFFASQSLIKIFHVVFVSSMINNIDKADQADTQATSAR